MKNANEIRKITDEALLRKEKEAEEKALECVENIMPRIETMARLGHDSLETFLSKETEIAHKAMKILTDNGFKVTEVYCGVVVEW